MLWPCRAGGCALAGAPPSGGHSRSSVAAPGEDRSSTHRSHSRGAAGAHACGARHAKKGVSGVRGGGRRGGRAQGSHDGRAGAVCAAACRRFSEDISAEIPACKGLNKSEVPCGVCAHVARARSRGHAAWWSQRGALQSPALSPQLHLHAPLVRRPLAAMKVHAKAVGRKRVAAARRHLRRRAVRNGQIGKSAALVAGLKAGSMCGQSCEGGARTHRVAGARDRPPAG
jgi:hypothetical protein